MGKKDSAPNADKGKDIFVKKCAQCHVCEKGKGNKTGKCSIVCLFAFDFVPTCWLHGLNV